MDEVVRILVVDDDAVDRVAVRRGLKASGLLHAITEVENGAAARAALEQASFDCVLLDYHLPDADGIDVLRTLRAAGGRVPVIVLTGQGDEQLAVEIMKAGATDYIAKSRFSPDRLESSIRHALRVSEAEAKSARARLLQQQAEAALRHNERFLAITLRSIGDAVIATDAEGMISFMNHVAERLTGWSAETASGRPIEDVLPLFQGDARKSMESPFRQVLRTGTTVESGVDMLAASRDGGQIPVATSSAPIRGDDGAMIGVVVVFRDMTEQVRFEQRLQFLADVSRLLSSSLDYEQSLSRLPNLVVPRFADYCAIDVARTDTAIERIAVAAVEQVQSASPLATVGCIVDAEQPYGSATVLRSGRTEHYPDLRHNPPPNMEEDDQAFVAVSGLVSWICAPLAVRGSMLGVISLGRTTACPRFDADDVAFVEELSQRASLALDNALLYQEARDAVQLRDTFLSIAAHELKTPLTAMLGYTQLLQRRVESDPTVNAREQRVVNIIGEQAGRLNKMIQALFDLSRLQIGQLTLELAPVNVGVLLSRIVSEIEPTLEQHSLHLTIEGERLEVLGDELRLEQVIQNFVNNAIKYSPAGGPIHARVSRQEQWVRVSVRDTGIGIPREALDSVFERFYRAANTEAHSISGMGVGLYVARQIVELHGGRVEVESIEGEGSTFAIVLPLWQEQPPD
jgi:PAS domain S-box-containing protein